MQQLVAFRVPHGKEMCLYSHLWSIILRPYLGKSFRAEVLNWGNLDPRKGHLAMPGYFWLSQLRKRTCYRSISSSGDQDIAKYPAKHRTASHPPKNYLTPNVNNAEGEKSSFRGMPKSTLCSRGEPPLTCLFIQLSKP